MLSRLQKFLKPPSYDDWQKNNQAKNTYAILIFFIALSLAFLFYSLTSPVRLQTPIAIIAIGIELCLLILLCTGRVRLTGMIFVSLLWIAISVEEYLYGGVRDSGFSSYAIVIVIAGLSLGINGGVLFTFLSILAGFGFIYLENAFLLPSLKHFSNTTVLLSHSVAFISLVILISLVIRDILSVSKRLDEKNRAIHEISNSLEQSKAESKDKSTDLDRHAKDLELIFRAIKLTDHVSSEKDLIEKTVALVADRFHVDHIDVYITDESGEFLTLFVANSEQGKALIQSDYQLFLSRSNSSIDLSSSETLHFQAGDWIYKCNNPIKYPNTNMARAFGLIVRDKFIGLINLQSSLTDPYFIDQHTMQAVADQTAFSILNIRLNGQILTQSQEINRLTKENILSGWGKVQSGASLGYLFNKVAVLPSDEVFPNDVREQLLAQKTAQYTTMELPVRAKLATPIVLRGNVIGVIGYENSDPKHEWFSDEITMLETIALRVSLALENTRLVADAQQRAYRERTLSQIASSMRETLDIDVILQTAVKEMKKSLSLKKAQVLLTTENSSLPEQGQSEEGAGK